MSPGVNHFNRMYSSSQFVPSTGLVSDNRSDDNYVLPFSASRSLPARKALREMMEHMGRNPKLIGELAAKKSRDERIALLVNQQLITFVNNLPAPESVRRKDPSLALSRKPAGPFEGATGACSLIVCAGSYEA